MRGPSPAFCFPREFGKTDTSVWSVGLFLFSVKQAENSAVMWEEALGFVMCSRGSDNMARELLDVELIKHVLMRKQYQYMKYGLLNIFKYKQYSNWNMQVAVALRFLSEDCTIPFFVISSSLKAHWAILKRKRTVHPAAFREVSHPFTNNLFFKTYNES